VTLLCAEISSPPLKTPRRPSRPSLTHIDTAGMIKFHCNCIAKREPLRFVSSCPGLRPCALNNMCRRQYRGARSAKEAAYTHKADTTPPHAKPGFYITNLRCLGHVCEHLAEHRRWNPFDGASERSWLNNFLFRGQMRARLRTC
jgi:hypothetical protein